MLEFFATTSNRKRTVIFLGLSGALVVGAALVGIDDNPPGLVLGYLSAIFFIIALVHPWKHPRNYWRLTYGSVLAFALFVVLHNAFEVLASQVGTSSLNNLLEVVGGAAFLVATLICPPALLVGAFGVLVTSRRERHSHPGGAAGTAS